MCIRDRPIAPPLQPQKAQQQTVQSIQQQAVKPIVPKDNMVKSQNVVSTVPNVQTTLIPQQQTVKPQNTKQSVIPNIQTQPQNIVKPIAPPLQPQKVQQQTQSIPKTVIPNIQTQQPIVNNHHTIVTPSVPTTPVQQPIILKNVQPVTSQTSQIQKETKK